ncbi:uncharacterized protein stbd1 [Polypterus senegalus]
MLGGYDVYLLLGTLVVLTAWVLFIVLKNVFGNRSQGHCDGEPVATKGDAAADMSFFRDGNATDEDNSKPFEAAERPCSRDVDQEGLRHPYSDPNTEPVLASAKVRHVFAGSDDRECFIQPTANHLVSKEVGDGAWKKSADANSGVKAAWDGGSEKTEISIMEATMNDNEWLKAQDACDAHLENKEAVESATAATTTATALCDPETDHLAKKVAAVSPMQQNVGVTFRVHYITHLPSQLVAVTGNSKELGNWESYVPLKQEKDGFWSDCVALLPEGQVEWKFIVVEDGKIRRWEECHNRSLETGHDDLYVHKWWGYH